MPTLGLETCENCRRVIGRLETPQVYADHIVCAECYARLTSKPATQDKFSDPQANAQAARTMFRVFFWIIAGAVILHLLSEIQWANNFNLLGR